MRIRHLILFSAFLILLFSGCKKKAFDPLSKSQNDFIGTWKGSISTFKDNKVITENGDVVIFPEAGGNLLGGIFFLSEISVFHEFQFSNGTLYFKVNCNDPANPSCQKWSLAGYALFSEEGKIDIRISGNGCGLIGNEYVDWTGTMALGSVPSDSLQYYYFAKTGNQWSYKITKKYGDTCQIQKQITMMPSDYYFQGGTNQSCGWPGLLMTLKWTLSPYEFAIVNDSTLSHKLITFPIDAKLGVVYTSILDKKDTVTVTLTDKDLAITTPAGIFNCVRFKYTEPISSGTSTTTRISYIWLNNRYGIIRQEVFNPVDSTDIQVQELKSKNF